MSSSLLLSEGRHLRGASDGDGDNWHLRTLNLDQTIVLDSAGRGRCQLLVQSLAPFLRALIPGADACTWPDRCT